MEKKTMKVGRRKVTYYYDNFNYYQPNDHVASDCAIRAVARALNITWVQAYDKLCAKGREMFDVPSSTDVVGKVLEENGFVWSSNAMPDGTNRLKVHEVAEIHKTLICVVRVAHHLTCTKDGKYHDIWDCGGKPIYGFWFKKK